MKVNGISWVLLIHKILKSFGTLNLFDINDVIYQYQHFIVVYDFIVFEMNQTNNQILYI